MKRILILIVVSANLCVWLSCKGSLSSETDSSQKTQTERIYNADDNENSTILIYDKTGKPWDITRAVKKYKMLPENFQFGLGPYAIPPIIDPKMISPGDPGYPDESNTFRVLGTTIENDTRAYPLLVLGDYEVANDQFDDIYVAFAF